MTDRFPVLCFLLWLMTERDSFETLSTSVASSTSSSGSGHPTSYQRKLLKQHKAFFNNSFANT